MSTNPTKNMQTNKSQSNTFFSRKFVRRKKNLNKVPMFTSITLSCNAIVCIAPGQKLNEKVSSDSEKKV